MGFGDQTLTEVPLNQGVGEDPRYLSGRLDEYHATKSSRMPSMAKETERYYTKECRLLFEKIRRDCPWMFKAIIYPMVAREAFPQRRPNRLEKAIEREYLRTPRSINMIPSSMTRFVIRKYRLSDRRYPEILGYSQSAKKRLQQRTRDEIKRKKRQCQDERMQ
jgi:hypothetical protein